MKRHPQIDEYIRQVCSQIKSKEVHEAISQELEGHFADRIADYQSEGMSEKDAVDRAILQMGDSHLIGKQLHQTHKPRIEWSLVGMVAALVGIGLLTLYSLLDSQSLVDSQFQRQILSVVLGAAVLAGILFADYRKLLPYCKQLYMTTLLVMLISLMTSEQVNGSLQYLDLGLFRFDFLSLSPILLVLSVAGLFSQWRWESWRDFSKALVVVLVPLLIYMSASRMFIGLLYVIWFGVLLFSSQMRRMYKWSFVGLIMALFLAAIGLLFAKPYAISRLLIFLDPYKDPLGAGYQTVQSMEAIRSAGWWGHGFGAQLAELPVTESDFVFAYLVYSFGWIVGGAVLLIGILLLYRIQRAMGQVKDRFGSLLIRGLMAVFFVPFFWSILMALGIVPIFSVSLPFISYGGTQFVLQMAVFGIILSVYRRKDITVLAASR
ncbi:FtsW/RodA/SpoVE family cell cycle protein [Brevibacillus centrosporus]|uniref:FtsW/RodA/SpoVE family cell cycle protein n=1 Tax=Brevibacillus centrosporus TaxID=54910 RepID=UPI002E23DCFC|nr:FtsW/RodA/SpoVE family cell cycle protein [Brevibacillus centrosporus]MED4909068.1 FtsW/RodA/SpoVE family cell cycle protein [Brevibacillus centrosporus]